MHAPGSNPRPATAGAELIGAVLDTDGRVHSVYQDCDSVRVDMGSQRAFFTIPAARAFAEMLLDGRAAALLHQITEE